MQLDTSKLRGSTKRFMALLVIAGSLFQNRDVHDWLILQAHGHPHFIGLIGTLTGLAMLLHEPEVRDALGIKRTVNVTTEEVALKTPEAGDGA